MSVSLVIRNRQRKIPIRLPGLRRLTRELLREFDPRDFDLGIYIVAAPEMIRLNERFLRHQGSTDVITFDYGPDGKHQARHGEIFLCLDEAIEQARRFRTTWQNELVRYVIHGLLHLSGYTDTNAAARREMKRVENRRLREIARRFPLDKLAGRRKPRRHSHD